MIVDAHQHFWDPARGDYGWLKPDSPLYRVFSPADLQLLMAKVGVDATILVQAAPTTEETDYILGLARGAPWILGVVGWINLLADNAIDQVQRRARDPLFLGVRPMLQDLDDPDWILQPCLTPVLDAIASEGLVFDALILSHQIGAIAELAARHPKLSIVLDHAAKPRLGNSAAMKQWYSDLSQLAEYHNVTCKFSGLLTELPEDHSVSEVRHVANTLYTLFGPERLIWGSDWPVLTVAGEYQSWFELARDIIGAKSREAMAGVMGRNALRIYQAYSDQRS